MADTKYVKDVIIRMKSSTTTKDYKLFGIRDKTKSNPYPIKNFSIGNDNTRYYTTNCTYGLVYSVDTSTGVASCTGIDADLWDPTDTDITIAGAVYSSDLQTMYPVTSIASSAFSGNTNITSVVIGKNVTTIGNSAFSGCTGLTSITIGEEVAAINYRAFYNCTNVTSVLYLATGMVSIASSSGACPFYNLGSNTSKGFTLTLGPEVTAVPGYLFYDSAGTSRNVKLYNFNASESQLSTIGANAFRYCTSLYYCTWPRTLASIGNYAFDGCTSFAFFNWSGTGTLNLESIGSYAFRNCALQSVQLIGESLTIGPGAFYSNTALTDITLCASLVYDHAFAYCTALTTVYLQADYLNSYSIKMTFDSDDDTNDSGVFYGSGNVNSIVLYTDGGLSIGELSADFYASHIEYSGIHAHPFYTRNGQHSAAAYLGGLYYQIGGSSPNQIYYATVTTDLSPALFFGMNLTALVIAPGSTKISCGKWCIAYSKIQALTLNDGDVSINSMAFQHAEWLTNVAYNIVSSSYNTAITDNNFGVFAYSGADSNNSSSLTITIGVNVEKIPPYLFGLNSLGTSYSGHITDIVFTNVTSSKCTEIGEQAFAMQSYIDGHDCTWYSNDALTQATYANAIELPGIASGSLVIGANAFHMNEFENLKGIIPPGGESSSTYKVAYENFKGLDANGDYVNIGTELDYNPEVVEGYITSRLYDAHGATNGYDCYKYGFEWRKSW